MTDLYAALDLDRDATPEDVRAAYRHAAKTAHPDAGGDPRRWHVVQRAHAVLSDPERRATYDRTGDDADPVPDTPLARAVPLVSWALDQVMDKEPDLVRIDVVARIRAVLSERERQAHQHMARAEARAAALAGIRDRFVTDGDSNVMASMIASRLDGLAEVRARTEADIASVGLALRLLSGFRYRSEPMVVQVGYLKGLANSTGTGLFSNMGVF
jgi:curved DNA-binding protein CbpA